MNAKELSVEVYNALVEIDYARKPNSFEEATRTHFNYLPVEVQAAIQSFPLIYIDSREDLMNVDTGWKSSNFTWLEIVKEIS
jgi:hypothetical protein